jgi:glycosyltransferase involved in cell wall biosynthesis
VTIISRSNDRTAPLISIMLPVYEPQAMLLDALNAVLKQRQSIGAEQMQIGVVDDCSRRADVAELLSRLGQPAAIEFHRNTANLGLAGNWNRCIELARGTLVHLLHQDDVIRPGFYERLLAGFAKAPHIGMAFCRHGFIDLDGALTDVSHREKLTAGVLRDWLSKIARELRIQTPAAIVKRSVYEQLGGFRTDLKYALDWEMWTRIAIHHEVWYEPRILADYRRHSANETARLQLSGAADADALRAIEVIGTTLPPERGRELSTSAYIAYARRRIKRARKQIAQQQLSLAHNSLHHSELALQRVPASARRTLYDWTIKRLRKQLDEVVTA